MKKVLAILFLALTLTLGLINFSYADEDPQGRRVLYIEYVTQGGIVYQITHYDGGEAMAVIWGGGE